MEERGIGGENGMAATQVDAAQEIGRIMKVAAVSGEICIDIEQIESY